MARFGLAIFAFLLIGPSTFACSVPVFRYALERWQPSRYEIVVYHRGPLDSSTRASVRRLDLAASRTNGRVTKVDLAGRVDPNFQAVWNREAKNASLPLLLVRYPETGPDVPSAWTGPLSTDPGELFNSLARRATFERLTTGHAGVILLVLSGDVKADAAAREFLQREVPRIATGIDLPPQTLDGPQVMSELPLWIRFPVVEVARTPAEDVLVRILLGSEDGLAAVKGPIAFPVFGRGRALCSLHGKDLTDPDELKRSLQFICRACSCQVKELNPGVDLLMTGDWDTIFDAERGPPARIIGRTGPPDAETRAGSAGFESVAELRSEPPMGYAAAELEPASRRASRRSSLLRFGTLAAGLLVVASAFWIYRGRRAAIPPASD